MNTSIAPVGPTLLDKARDGVEGAGWVIQQLRGSIQEMRRAPREVALQAPSKAPAALKAYHGGK